MGRSKIVLHSQGHMVKYIDICILFLIPNRSTGQNVHGFINQRRVTDQLLTNEIKKTPQLILTCFDYARLKIVRPLLLQPLPMPCQVPHALKWILVKLP